MAEVTPMMRQYLSLKERNPDCLLFFRLGDFYEMFFEDAETAARELEIVLTGRDCGMEERAPMCGVPHHAVDNYIHRLIQKGYKVALCEQVSDPKAGKGIVEREIVRIITPGTLVEPGLLSESANHFLACLFYDGGSVGLANVDVSTGQLQVKEYSPGEQALLWNDIARLQPAEIIVNDALLMQKDAQSLQQHYFVSAAPAWTFESDTAQRTICGHFAVGALDGLGLEGLPYGVCALGALLAYLQETQKNALAHIRGVQILRHEQAMALDAATRRNLELTQPLRQGAGKKSTLLGLLNRTQTAMGARLLRAWVEQPLQSLDAMQQRLDAVEEFKDDPILRQMTREALQKVYDIERLCSKLAYATFHARDALSLLHSLGVQPGIKENLLQAKSALLTRFAETDALGDIAQLLEQSIAPQPPAAISEGGIIREGYDAEIDRLRALNTEGDEMLQALETEEREKTGIKNLKIGYNRVFGYYLEVTKSYQSLVPYHYQRKQTLSNCERYTMPQLKAFEKEKLEAQELLVEREYEVFCAIRAHLLENIERLQALSQMLAQLDALQSLAHVAAEYDYAKPELHDGDELVITTGRHPVVERVIRDRFVPNDSRLDANERIIILTGPNMAGKSTYMRQVALIALLAHIGSFVPALHARVPLIDRIFTRVGASDDLAGGQSTFMVEMSELANILRHATSRSLILLDEIGRGTSTFDGLSIAWAAVEHIADASRLGAKTLFATHYHELSELEGILPGVTNFRISVKEVGEDILFLRKIVRGGSDKSFGIQVARLAGLPEQVIARAKEILLALEAADINRAALTQQEPDVPQLAVQTSLLDASNTDLAQELRHLKIEEMTPVQALNLLYEWHMRVSG